MESGFGSKIKFFFLILFAITTTIPFSASAYEIGTHAYLTKEAFDFYSKNFQTSDIGEYVDFLVDGSRREDDTPRWMNHFYDPVKDRGLTYDPSIDAGVNFGTWQKSKDWAKDSNNQNSLTYKVPATIASILTAFQKLKVSEVSNDTDFVWQEAIRHYANNENEKAMFALGHILHLIQDLSVPDHTRNDTHNGDSPYENFSSKYTLLNMDDKLQSRLGLLNNVQLANLDEYFNDLANYSNKNFYSKDTAGIQSGYHLPEINYFGFLEDGREYGMRHDDVFGDYPLIKASGIFESKTDDLLNRVFITDAYWSRLSARAVQYSAGVIDLFFKEAEAAKNDPNFSKDKPKSFFASLINTINNGVSLFSDVVKNVFYPNQESQYENNFDTENDYEENVFEDQENQDESPVIGEVLGISTTTNELTLGTDVFYESTTIDNFQLITSTTPNQIISTSTQTSATSTASTTTLGTNQSSGGSSRVEKPAPIFYNVVINEIMYDFPGSDEGKEWIEILNKSTSTIDLSEWMLYENGVNHGLDSVAGSIYLTQGAYAVISNNTEKFLSEYPDFSGRLFKASFSLSNSGEMIAIKNDTLLINEVTYSSSTGARGDGRSLQIINNTWNSSTPTPGKENKFNELENQNISPTARFIFSPNTPKVGEIVLFDASSSEDDKKIENYEWDFGDGENLTDSHSSTTHVYNQEGNFNISLSVFDNENASNTTTTVISIFPKETVFNEADNLVISEVLFNASGGDDGKEFIELYNPTETNITIEDWSLRYRVSGSTTTNSIVVFHATSSGDKVDILPNSFYLVGLNNYDSANFSGVEADAIRSKSLPNGSSEIEIILSDQNDNVVDNIFYSDTSTTDEGQSIERKSFFDSKCISGQNDGEFFGNSCDNDSNLDFEIREHPKPQNTLNLKEPRIQPSNLLPINGSENIMNFNFNAMKLDFEWNTSTAELESFPLTYRIEDKSVSSTTLSIIETTSTAISIPINEIGREYSFETRVFDRDGFESATTSYKITIDSFVNDLYLYNDTRSGLEEKYSIDLYYKSFPFMPHLFSGLPNSWQGIVFYLNRDPNKENTILAAENSYSPQNNDGIFGIVYKNCAGNLKSQNSIIFPTSNEWCGPGGGLQTESMSSEFLEDKHIIINSDVKSSDIKLTESDYITVAFYDFSNSGGGRQDLSLVAIDFTKRYFQNEKPAQKSPNFDVEISEGFETKNSTLTLSWPPANDEDTIDSKLSYEINFSTSTEFDDNLWKRSDSENHHSLIVSPDDSFLIGVRAKDDFGNVSSVATTSWVYPKTNFHFIQDLNDGWSYEIGIVNFSSDEPDAASFQSITPTESFSFDKAVVKMMHGTGSSLTTLRLSVFGDTGGGAPDFNNFIGGALFGDVGLMDQGQKVTFTFDQPVLFEKDTRYWFALDVYSYGDPNGYFVNAWENAVMSGDVYSGGRGGRGRIKFCDTGCDGCVYEKSYDFDWYLKLGLEEKIF